MIRIIVNGKLYYSTCDVRQAIQIIKRFKYRHRRVEWICDDPEDNEEIWLNT